jgi:hypothetical protein
MSRPTKFIPKLKSAFDFQTLQQMRAAINGLLNGTVVAGKTPQVHYSDANTVWEFPTTLPPLEKIYPFKVYKTTPPGVPLDKDGNPKLPLPTAITFDATTGVQKVCNIDTTKPTDFSAAPPTVNPTTDAWRFYALRGGYIQIRSYFSVLATYSNNYFVGYLKDYNQLVQPENGTDGLTPWGVPGEPSDSWDMPRNVSVEGAGGDILVIPSNSTDASDLDSSGYIMFSLWLEINPDIDSSDEVTVKVKGNRWDLQDFTNYPAPPFQDSPNIIPIAVIKSQFANPSDGGTDAYNLIIDQIQSGHVINRYMPGMYNLNGGTPTPTAVVPSAMVSRGNWDIDDIKDQVFYPGDVITINFEQPVIGVAGTKIDNLDQWMCEAICFTTDPTNDINFINVGGKIYFSI